MNFKKGTALLMALLMAFLLLVSNAGLAFSVHFCEGRIASISSAFNNAEACEMQQVIVEKGCCAKKIVTSHKKCCTDKVVSFKGKTGDGVVKAFSFHADAPVAIHLAKSVVFKRVFFSKKSHPATYYCDAHAPPLFKLYSQYIFYA